MNKKAAELSKDLEYHYLMTSLNASISKHMLDEHFTLVAANSRYYELFGYTKTEYEALYENRPDLFFKDSPEEWKKLNEYVMDAIQSGRNRYDCIMQMKHRNGQKLWIRLIGIFIDEYVEGCQISYSIMMDITDSMQTKIERDAVQDTMPGLVSKYRVTADGYEFLEGNRNYYAFFKQPLSFHKDEIQKHAGLDSLVDMYPAFRRGQSCSFMISPIDQEGKTTYFTVNAQCIYWIGEDPIYMLIYNDITELKAQQQQLEEYNQMLHTLVYSDELTGGYNRRKFEQDAAECVSGAPEGSYCMLWLNLQKFKAINDTAGADLGDATLVYIHNAIRKHLEKNEFTARIYSDNFVILMKNNESLEMRIQQMIEDVNSYNRDSEYKYYLTFTIGVYRIVDPHMPITYCEDRAHAAKKSAETKINEYYTLNYYTDSVFQKMLYDKKLENRMQDALANQEFKIYLQPKFSIKKQAFTGAEALIRWDDPKQGVQPPDTFIPLFEANGFIVQIDYFVFEEVCKLIKSWINAGWEPVKVSVNMSRRHFSSPGFMDFYVRTSEKYEIPKQYLEIELTETMVFESPEAFAKIVQRIHDAGFSCSLDDFGSGYSTLSTLKDLDVDAIKLDKSFFTAEQMNNTKENIIVENILDMSKALEMVSIAEGIETDEQKEFLYRTSCDLIQGYVFSKPVPPDDFNELVYGNCSEPKAI